MNPFEIPSGQFTLDATSECEWHRFIKVNAEGNAEYATAATDAIVGVSYADAKAGQPLAIVGAGIAMVEANETIAAGDIVNAGAGGKAAKAATGNGYPALTGGDTGTLVTVKVGLVAGARA